jgi:hypothetical protein
VTPPNPSPLVAERCVHLNVQLPQQIEHLTPRVIEPTSQFVHAWGDPAVVLTCGVPFPPGYSPTSSSTTAVNGVRWFEEESSDTVTWTAISKRPLARGQIVNVQVEIPTSYDGQGAFLVDLAPALKTTLS